MLQQYLVNISRTSTKLLPQLEEGPSFQTEGPLTKKNGMPRLCRIRMSCRDMTALSVKKLKLFISFWPKNWNPVNLSRVNSPLLTTSRCRLLSLIYTRSRLNWQIARRIRTFVKGRLQTITPISKSFLT